MTPSHLGCHPQCRKICPNAVMRSISPTQAVQASTMTWQGMVCARYQCSEPGLLTLAFFFSEPNSSMPDRADGHAAYLSYRCCCKAKSRSLRSDEGTWCNRAGPAGRCRQGEKSTIGRLRRAAHHCIRAHASSTPPFLEPTRLREPIGSWGGECVDGECSKIGDLSSGFLGHRGNLTTTTAQTGETTKRGGAGVTDKVTNT